MEGQQLGLYCSEGLMLLNNVAGVGKEIFFSASINDVTMFEYSPDGVYLAIASKKKLYIATTNTLEIVSTVVLPDILAMCFSPSGKYIVVQKTRVCANSPVSQYRAVNIFKSQSLEFCHAHDMRSPNPTNIKWTRDETMYVIASQGTLSVYITETDKCTTWKFEGLLDVSVSPGAQPYVALFLSDRKISGSRTVEVRRIDSIDAKEPVTKVSVMSADSVSFKWSPCGKFLLFLATMDTDPTGASYYGGTTIYLSQLGNGTSGKVELDVVGTVYSAEWNPKKSEFAVIYGNVPARASIYNFRGVLVHSFGNNLHNYVAFNPQGTKLLLGGFGNLLGEVNVWDLGNYKKLGSMVASCTSECKWSQDGNYIMTSTLYKRLKVDNKVLIWHYKGVPVEKIEFPKIFQACWKPHVYDPDYLEANELPEPVPFEGYVSEKEEEVQLYRPPSARGVVVIGKDTTSMLPPPPNTYYKSKKKAVTSEGPKRGVSMGGKCAAIATVEDEAAVVKKIKSLKKKLRQVKKIKAKVETGAKVELNQLTNLSDEMKIISEIENLESMLKSVAIH